MTERINKIIRFYKLNSSKFADEIGVQRSSISHVLSGRNKPSLDFIQKLLKAYPEINSDWLILGKGKMLLDEGNLFENIPEKTNSIKTEESMGATTMIENTTPTSAVKVNQSNEINEAKKISSQSAKKQVSKIVIFYTDKTFKEYLPED